MKYSGVLGYSSGEQVQSKPGVWEDVIVERKALGDVPRNNRRLNPGETANDDISVGTTLSIVMDPFVRDHFANLRYARWMGIDWSVITAEPVYPRLTVTLGGVYNGPKATAPVTTGISDGGSPTG